MRGPGSGEGSRESWGDFFPGCPKKRFYLFIILFFLNFKELFMCAFVAIDYIWLMFRGLEAHTFGIFCVHGLSVQYIQLRFLLCAHLII